MLHVIGQPKFPYFDNYETLPCKLLGSICEFCYTSVARRNFQLVLLFKKSCSGKDRQCL